MQPIETHEAPQAIGSYSQAVKAGQTVYLSGQIALDKETMNLVSDDFVEQARQVFLNLKAVCEAAGGSLKDIVMLNIFLTDMANFQDFNQVMQQFFDAPYPARAAVEVSALPKGAIVEACGTMVLE